VERTRGTGELAEIFLRAEFAGREKALPGDRAVKSCSIECFIHVHLRKSAARF
jgi:hypothetical protein